jgi:hypothetical protein
MPNDGVVVIETPRKKVHVQQYIVPAYPRQCNLDFQARSTT